MRVFVTLLVVLTAAAAEARAADLSATMPAASAASASPMADAAPVQSPAATAAPAVPEAPEIVPFYSFRWTEAGTIPSVGSTFLSGNYGTSLGAKCPINGENALFGAYDLAYAGPGMKTQEGREFAERAIDHNAILEHQWSGFAGHTVKTRGLFMKEMRRTGASEIFGKGLYDFNVWGGGVSDDWAWRPGSTLGYGLTYQYFSFPNYTDLLQEFQSASGYAESGGGQEDYHNIRLQAEGRLSGKGRAWLSASLQQYVKEKVLKDTGVAGTTGRHDVVTDVGASWNAITPKSATWGTLAAIPTLRLTFKRSNQNFLKYRFLGDTQPPQFLANYYSFNAVEIGVPGRWSLNDRGTGLYLAPRWIGTFYTRRPPRDAADVYQPGKQRNGAFVLSTGLTWGLSKVSRWSFGYTFQQSTSNNHSERFVPYNYSGNVIYTAFEVEY